MDKQISALQGELMTWKAFGEEAIKRLPPDQRTAIVQWIAPGLQRIADRDQALAASQALAEISRRR